MSGTFCGVRYVDIDPNCPLMKDIQNLRQILNALPNDTTVAFLTIPEKRCIRVQFQSPEFIDIKPLKIQTRTGIFITI